MERLLPDMRYYQDGSYLLGTTLGVVTSGTGTVRWVERRVVSDAIGPCCNTQVKTEAFEGMRAFPKSNSLTVSGEVTRGALSRLISPGMETLYVCVRISTIVDNCGESVVIWG